MTARDLAAPLGRAERLRRRAQALVDPAVPGGEAYDLFMAGLICVNVAALVLETVRPLYDRHAALFAAFEGASVAVFTVDYLLRLWLCTLDPRYAAPVRGRLRYARTPLALLDLAAVLPFFLPMLGADLRFVRAARLLRLLRLGKLARYSSALQMVARVLVGKKEELFTTLVVAGVLLLGSSAVMYFVERDAQPQAFSSVPAAMWWGIATLTTVGFGDVYPVTPLGKLVSGIIALVGIGIIALPTGILSAGFIEEMQARRAGAARCPHCGGELHGTSTPHPDRP
ncbi:MAG TPA: potassium channel family protein [Longimicrobiaceae bacterium]|nr:potassium channel family protein [Longimicrobiaceae bacterium]